MLEEAIIFSTAEEESIFLIAGLQSPMQDQYRFCYVAVREELEDLIAWGSG